MKRLTLAGISYVTIAGMMLTGCDLGGGRDMDLEQWGADDQATIKVMSTLNERTFYQQYGSLFIAKYPNIEIQFVSTQGAIYNNPEIGIDKAYEEFIDTHKPDVMILPIDQYGEMVEQGQLYELDSVIKQDKFDMEGILPAVLDLVKSHSGGKLYGLAPGFSSQALFYNKTLFDKQGIPLPDDGMTWEQILELAKRFPTAGNDDNRPFGLTLGTGDSLFRFIMVFGTLKGLNYVDPSGSTLMLNSASWNDVAQQSLDAFRSKAIYLSSQPFLSGTIEQYYQQEPFIGGKAAMTIMGTSYLDTLKQAKPVLKDNMPEWDLVTMPYSSENPDSSPLSVSQIFTVNANSPNLRAAWEFVKYVNSEEYARVMSKTTTMGNILSRIAYAEDPEGRNIEAFYKNNNRSSLSFNRPMPNVPEAFVGQLFGISEPEFKAVLEGKKTLDEALQIIQEKGQAQLTKVRQEQSNESK